MKSDNAHDRHLPATTADGSIKNKRASSAPGVRPADRPDGSGPNSACKTPVNRSASACSADDVRRAMSTDFDGDGDPLAAELGLQSGRRGDALAEQVDNNTGRIDDLETGVDGRASDDDLDITPGEFDDDIVGGLR